MRNFLFYLMCCAAAPEGDERVGFAFTEAAIVLVELLTLRELRTLLGGVGKGVVWHLLQARREVRAKGVMCLKCLGKQIRSASTTRA